MDDQAASCQALRGSWESYRASVSLFDVCLPWIMGTSVVAQTIKNLPAVQETRVHPWVGKIPWRRAWQPTPVFLPGESLDGGAWQATVHGGHKESDRTERLTLTWIMAL